MSQTAGHAGMSRATTGVARPLSLRARLLRRLEAVFPPLTDAPASEGEIATYEYAKAESSYAPLVAELGGIEGRTVLDFGCGWGGESAWLARRAGHVVGCDVNDDALRQARRFQAESGLRNLEFARCADDALPFADDSFDAVFSTNVFEHVMRPETMLAEIRRVLRPGGAFVSTFGPLFYSPLGYHLPWACRVPWAHLIFGLRPIIEVRNTRRAPIDPDSWEDTGLNRITFERFRDAAGHAGFDVRRLERIPVRGLGLLAATPGVGRLFTFGVKCHLIKPTARDG